MLDATVAIVLSKTNYSESSIVVQLYTQKFGRLAIMVPGVKKRRSNAKLALFEPLSLIEVIIPFKNTKTLFRTTNIKLLEPHFNIQQDIYKRTITLFLSDVLSKILKEHQKDEPLFEYIQNSLGFLDAITQSVANFHLVFLIRLTQFLGFFPRAGSGKYFDLHEGAFVNSYPTGGRFLADEEKDNFYTLLETNFDNLQHLKITNTDRKKLLENTIQYIQIHVSGIKDISSHHILETIFH